MVAQFKFQEDVLQKFNSINESAIIAYTDLRGTILEVNDLFCKISGYTREELIGKDHRIINSGYHDKEFFKGLWSTIQNGNIWTGEIQNRAKDGTLYWVHTVISPVRDESGQIINYMAIRFEITRQKIMELQLKTSDERWKLALAGSERGVWDWELKDQKFHVSEHVPYILGIPENQKIASFESFISAVHPDDRQYVRDTIEAAVFRKEKFNFDHRILWDDGTVHWINNRGDVIFSKDKEPARVIGVIIDITSKKQLEETNQKLAASAKLSALGEMACSIVHEINNPLAIIFGRLAILKMHLSEMGIELNENFLSSIDQIETAANRMANITKGLNAYSRNAEKDPMSQVLATRFITDTVEFCRDNFRFYNVELKIDIADISQCKILGRSGQLSQVLLNLLLNALDAVKELPRKWVHIQGFLEKDNIVVQVIDSGNGIPSEVVSKIMQPFFTTKREGHGTGLGLSISKKIVDEHNGKLFYDNSLANTCFRVEIPLIKQ